MSKLKELQAKGEKVKLSNGLELNIKPMTIDMEAEIGELIENDFFSKAMSKLVKNSIKDAFPNATDEEINNLNKKDLQKVIDKVLEINNMSKPDSDSKN